MAIPRNRVSSRWIPTDTVYASGIPIGHDRSTSVPYRRRKRNPFVRGGFEIAGGHGGTRTRWNSGSLATRKEHSSVVTRYTGLVACAERDVCAFLWKFYFMLRGIYCFYFALN